MRNVWTALVVVAGIVSSRALANVTRGDGAWFTLLQACVLALIATCFPAMFRDPILRVWLFTSGFLILAQTLRPGSVRQVAGLLVGLALCGVAALWRYQETRRARASQPDPSSPS